jgi:tetratricopeptide (TPR) repeat protein
MFRLRKVRLGLDHPSTLASMNTLANNYAAAGRIADAVSLREDLLARRRATLGPDHPDTVAAINGLAWLLVTATEAAARDARRAVDLATQSTSAAPKNASYRGTLGTARYRAGDHAAAVADLEHAIRLRKPDDPSNAEDGYFLAMAHWRLGAKDRAREWFDKSVDWHAKAKGDTAELKRFRVEAADLLGAGDKP